jgi:hypothetical protein
LAVAAGLGAAGCAPKAEPQPGLDLNFARLGPLPLRVAHIDVAETYQPMSAPPHVELQFAVPPDQAIRRWVADRMRAEGGTANLAIDITDADILEETLPVAGGLGGALTDQQNRQWTAHLAVNITLRSIDTGQIVSTTGFRIEHLITTPQSATPSDLREAQADLIRKAMGDFNRGMEMTLKQDMPQIVEPPS